MKQCQKKVQKDKKSDVFLILKTKKMLIFLKNNFDLSSQQIALIYKQHWQIELFFKWIKQHLKSEDLLG